jgi:two-component system response regulator AtoC
MSGRVLLVDDDSAMGEMVGDRLARRGFEAICCCSAEEALARLGAEDFDVLVTDVMMPGASGLELCVRAAELRPALPILIVTAFGSVETVVSAIRAGAHDFLHKPFEVEELVLRIDAAMRHRTLREELNRLRDATARGEGFGELLGESAPMLRLRELLTKVANAEGSILLSGETGTGKDVVARTLHARSGRRDGPFVALDCGAIPPNLLESELFGHARGAFTDARTERRGLCAQAHGGTLFLDEVGELPLALQPKLLRVLQERRVRPVGSDTEQPFDARVIAATNRDLEEAVERGSFRSDLFWRLAVFDVSLPPLRMRGNDVLLLAQRFVERFAELAGKQVVGISTPAAQRLLAYPWPGNVRELQNCIERAVALTGFDRIVVDDLPARVSSFRPGTALIASDDPAELVPLEEIERRYIQRVLQANAGNKTLAARTLGIDRKTLQRKLGRAAAEPEDEPPAQA